MAIAVLKSERRGCPECDPVIRRVLVGLPSRPTHGLLLAFEILRGEGRIS